ncbi:MAG: SPOR domain-containing protein [Acidobacteriota bacterium]
MAERQGNEVRELRLEGAGLFVIVAFLGAGLVGAFFLGRWYERSSAPPVGSDQWASDPLENVVPPEQVEDVDVGANRFDTIEGSTVAEPARQATPAVAQTSDAQPGNGSFYVQIAAFRDRGSADRIAAELDSAGYPVNVFSEDGPSGQLFKVRVGAYRTREEAATIAGELKTKGHPGAFPTKVD